MPVRPRRALVVAYDFPPHGAIGTMRTLRLVRHLAARGWRVTVLTGDPATFLPSTPLDSPLVDRIPANVDVVRARAWRRAQARRSTASAEQMQAVQPREERVHRRLARLRGFVNTLTGIPDRELPWLVPAIAAGVRAVRLTPPDVIYSSAPPWTGQLVACAIAARLRRPWVADFRDPWARAPWRDDRPAWLTTVLTALERLTVRRATSVIFTTVSLRDDIAAAHDPALRRKYYVVSNGCDPDEFRTDAAASTSSGFVLLHAGSLYGGRDPRPLIRAIAAGVAAGSIDRERFTLRLVGPIALEGERIDALCERLGLSGVVDLVPRLPRASALNAMSCASALLLVQPEHPLSIPAKAYEYLALGRPVLAMVDAGETADLILRSGAGLVVSPRDEQAILAAVLRLIRSEPLPHAASSFYDGELRAAEAAAVLEDAIGVSREWSSPALVPGAAAREHADV